MKLQIFKKIMAILLVTVLTVCLSSCGTETVTSEFWVYEDEPIDEESQDSTANNESVKDNTDNSSATSTTKPKGNKGNKDNKNGWNVKMVDVGTKGANGKDYSNYDPYEGIEKYKDTTVRFATWIDHAQDEMATPIEEFEEKYGIKIESVYCSQDGYIKEILALIAAGNAPDIIVENFTFPAILQVAQDISVSGIDINEPFWSQSMIKGMSYNGKNYFVNAVNSVVGANSALTIYNKDLLESNGIKTPSEYYADGEWTISNMQKIMKQVSALGSEYSGGQIGRSYLYAQYGGASAVTYDGTKFTNTLTSANMVTALKKELEILAAYGDDGTTNFIDGKAAMVLTDMYGLKATGYFKSMDPDSLGFTYLPRNDSASSEQPVTMTRGYGISKGSKNPKAAGYVLRYLLDGENYDLQDNCFISEEAANFFYELAGKYINSNVKYLYDDGVAEYVGTWYGYWTDGADTPDQASVVLQSHNNEAQNAVDKSNAFLKTIK